MANPTDRDRESRTTRESVVRFVAVLAVVTWLTVAIPLFSYLAVIPGATGVLMCVRELRATGSIPRASNVLLGVFAVVNAGGAVWGLWALGEGISNGCIPLLCF